jgi:hypothetical protein
VISKLPGISGAAVLLCASVFCASGASGAEPAKLVQTACVGCHTLETVTKKQATKEEWRGIVKTMIEKGAALKPDEASQVTEYLAAKYGRALTAEEVSKRDARGKALVESVCILCHEFARISSEALNHDQWAGEIRGMLAEGAPLTDEEFDIVVDYLTKTYGVKPEN